jgi:hypothetical protein
MNHKEIFQSYFMPLFLNLSIDPVKNVRIVVSRVLEAHFANPEGNFVFDLLVNQAVKIMKKDFCLDVRAQLESISTYPLNDTSEVDLDKFKADIKRLETNLIDTDSESESNSSAIDINMNTSISSTPSKNQEQEETE